MNAQERENRMFDLAAAQARVEGIASFGRFTGTGWTQARRERFAAAAAARGVGFAVDPDGFGYFYEEG